VSGALLLKELAGDDASLQLLRSPNLPVIVSVLRSRFPEPNSRMPAEDLYELVDEDLEALREHFALPKNGRAYCTDWRGSGWLVRERATETTGEVIALAPAAVAVFRVIEDLERPHVSATESRLLAIKSQLHDLVMESDPSIARRLELLQEQIDSLQERMEQVRSGKEDALSDVRAAERLTEIIKQARSVPGDLGRVRERFEQLSQDLRHKLLESDDSQSSLIEDVFRGVDHIEDSPEGRTFYAFEEMVRDLGIRAEFEGDLQAVLERDFAGAVDSADRVFLTKFLRNLKEDTREVHLTVTEFARSLRRYVQAREFQRDRVLRGLLREAQRAGVEVAGGVLPYADSGLTLEASSMRLSSLGAINLYDPESVEAEAVMELQVDTGADLEEIKALARETEIDLAALMENVENAKKTVKNPSIGQVLEMFPADQGVASLVGLLVLSEEHGTVEENSEFAAWTGKDGVRRRAQIPVVRFGEE